MDMVGAGGLEPPIPKEADFKSAAYANFATPPLLIRRRSSYQNAPQLAWARDQKIDLTRRWKRRNTNGKKG